MVNGEELRRQIEGARAEIEAWPQWMRGAAHFEGADNGREAPMVTMSYVCRMAAADLLIAGHLERTSVEDWTLEAAVEELEQKLHVIKGEQARRAALPEGHRP